MVEDYNRHWVEHQNLSEDQRHANMIEAAKRGEEHYQTSSKPPSQVWDRLYSIARFVIAAIAIVGLLVIVVGLLMFVVSVVTAVWGAVSSG